MGASQSTATKPSIGSSGAFYSGATTSTTTKCDAAPPPPPPISSSTEPSTTSLPIDPAATNNDSKNDGDDAIAQAAKAATALMNPGPYEQAPQDLKRLVMVDAHDGFRCDINKQLSPYMAVVHSFWLGTNMIPDGRKRTYTWLTQVADETSLYMARVDPERMSIDGRIHKAFLGGIIMSKLQVGVSAPGGEPGPDGSPPGANDQCLLDVDINGPSWSANVKYGSMGGGPMYGCAFHQAITPRLSMGGEGMYIGVNGNMMSSYLVKYSMPMTESSVDDALVKNAQPPTPPGAPPPENPSSTIMAQFAPAGPSPMPLTLNYKRVVTPGRVTLGAELACNPFALGAPGTSQATLGAEFRFSTKSKLHVTVDSNAKIQSSLETKLGKEPGQPSLNFSAELDHMKDEMRFGYGLSLDG
eukprot:CAMPEP_0113460882 /NCGR_PEP_ID=MMETSP0014_2-20120614/11234_1 /TAXON_ID=2857 /ORGANISM="Nitzschia sp." /LENGTH=412 /DNA_ID=CAMNT_0000352585 /DNA_START=298 /DNA_END=1536 /DNA_ORIENTATION=- /assembly_acc=CAM_ASM_000159